MVDLCGLKYQWNFDVNLFFGDSQSIGCLVQNRMLKCIKFCDNKTYRNFRSTTNGYSDGSVGKAQVEAHHN